ncbi:MAG: DUF475 domain-containing protein [Paracoccaceae bacterium]
MKSTTVYLKWPIIITFIGLGLSFWLGYNTLGGINGGLSFLFIGAVLAVLEISLSFDNAIVNASKLKNMTPLWQRRFLTWGILIAVFGMRIVFPLAIVVVAASVTPWAAIDLALRNPLEYGRILNDAHLSISAYGGTFLMMVALTFFFDQQKEVDWIKVLECRLRRWASVRGLEIGLVLAIVLTFAAVLPPARSATFLFAAIGGMVTFLAVDLLSNILDRQSRSANLARGGFGAFLYLEVLDASFSFDGVIGAFALTNNLILIAIGLGIGAFYVRGMTILLVERGTLAEFRYLEHGAFYSILALSVVMFANSVTHVPELVTGLVGASLILIALWSSLRYNRLNPEKSLHGE